MVVVVARRAGVDSVRGQIIVPMHDAATNRLTFPSFDPYSRRRSYKTGAVAVRPLHAWER